MPQGGREGAGPSDYIERSRGTHTHMAATAAAAAAGGARTAAGAAAGAAAALLLALGDRQGRASRCDDAAARGAALSAQHERACRSV